MVAVSDDDWFERALREDDETTGGEEESSARETGASEESATGENGAPDTDDAGGDTHSGGDTVRNEGDTATAEPDDANSGSTDDTDSVGGSTDDTGSGSDSTSDADSVNTGTDGTDNDGGSPFEQDFGSALEDAPEPDVGQSQPGEAGERGETGPFGGGQDTGTDPSGDDQEGDSPFGSGEAGDSPFGPEEGDDEFGFGGFGGEGPESFDETEEFESDLDRFDIGIDGLDQMILGGVPRRSLMVAIGSAGTGKTTFGLQFLHHGLQQGEDAVYITLEESYDRIVSTADEKGWGFGEYADEDRLAVIDIDPIEMANSLDSIQNDLPNLIEAFGADRLVLDSVSLLEMMYESAPKRRSQVFGFARSLKEAGITVLLTSEADRDHAYASRFGIVEYLADAVFVLQYVRPSDFQETRLAIEIQKIRDANHSRETKPYDLTAEGISVYRQANIF